MAEKKEACKDCIRYKTEVCEGDEYCPHFYSATKSAEQTIADIKMGRFQKKED